MLLRVFAVLILGALTARGEVVVAIRYLQVEGVSHSHLFLFFDDGSLVRQLTSATEGQDHDPVFSADGTVIAFGRETKAGEEWWTVGADGSGAKRRADFPEWAHAGPPNSFGYPKFVPVPNHPGERVIEQSATAGELRFPAPDGSCTLVLRETQEAQRADENAVRKDLFLRDEPSGTEWPVEKFPVTPFTRTGSLGENAMRRAPEAKAGEKDDAYLRYDGRLFDFLVLRGGSPFLISPPLRVAFFAQHRGSTDGEGRFAIDLASRKVTELTPNGARIVPLAGAPQFFSVCEERYHPLGEHNVNCSYLDRWDAELHRTRFAAPKPALFYGAAIFRAGKSSTGDPERGSGVTLTGGTFSDTVRPCRWPN